MPFKILKVHFDCAGSRNLRGRCGAVPIFAREASCKGLELFYFEMQFSWQVQRFWTWR